MKATVPPKQCEKEVEQFHVVTCEVEYFDVVNCKPEKLTESFSIQRSLSCPRPVPHSAHHDIVLHNLRCEVADTLGQAAERAGKGDMEEARRMLHLCRDKVKKSVAFATPLSTHLMATIDESIGGLENSTVFREHGRPTMMNFSHQHWQQRSSSKPSKEDYLSAKSNAPSRSASSDTSAGTASPLTYAQHAADNPYCNTSKAKIKIAYKGKKK